ncbi:MAG: rhamnulokinase [Barnesiella sp.]|nr:rhamnulokinase [Barnesiella sp.]
MNYPAYFVAFDLGATSGRTILATLHENGKMDTEEINRFPNAIINVNGISHWNIYSLFESIKQGMKLVAERGINPVSMAVDTWGVDIAAIASDGQLIGLPVAYRDSRFNSDNTDSYFAKAMSSEDLYARTGIQTLNFNTVFQLHALRDTFALLNSARIGFIPDVLSYLLSGKLITEYTIASTGALLNPHTGEFDIDVLDSVGIAKDKFGEIVKPGTVIGTLRPELQNETGLGAVPIVAVGGHDTASAVAAIPAEGRDWAFLSSGTWSLMGIENDKPVVTEDSRRHNMTNEGGIENTIRLLKNITGMWVLEECLKRWKAKGINYSYPELVEMASKAEPFKSFIDPDDTCFVAPADMPKTICEYCEKTGQPVPSDDSAIVRCIFESLAMKYRYVLSLFKEVASNPINRLNVIGGGSRNELLNTLTASAINLPVVAGPVEGTAFGNILVQAKAAGYVDSLDSLREVVRKNVPTKTYLPANPEAWDEPYSRFLSIINK